MRHRSSITVDPLPRHESSGACTAAFPGTSSPALDGSPNPRLEYASIKRYARSSRDSSGFYLPTNVLAPTAFGLGEIGERFVVARASLRQILAQYTGERPEHLVFNYGPFGSPVWYRRQANLRSGLTSAIRTRPRFMHSPPDVESESMSKGFFPFGWTMRGSRPMWLSGEVAEIAAAAASERTRAFYRAWTCQEALLKGTGRGLFPCIVARTASRVYEVVGILRSRDQRWSSLRRRAGGGRGRRLIGLPICPGLGYGHWSPSALAKKIAISRRVTLRSGQ